MDVPLGAPDHKEEGGISEVWGTVNADALRDCGLAAVCGMNAI